jgi:hypothetical protein
MGVAALARSESVSIAWACPEGVTPTKKSLPAKCTIAFVSFCFKIILSATPLQSRQKNNMAIFKKPISHSKRVHLRDL